MPSNEERRQSSVAGRSLDEQLDSIKKYGMHPVPPFLKSNLLRSFGIPRPKASAENLIKLGCNQLFSHTRYVIGYFKLLHLLGIDYTYLEKEYCCGAVPASSSQGAERQRALDAGKGFIQMNYEMARQKGAKTITYLCRSCAHYARAHFPDNTGAHLYAWDLILDKLASKPLRVAPTVAAYYGGCGGSSFQAVLHGPEPQWAKYRRFMNKIEGLTLVNLKGVCCRVDTESVVNEALSRNLDTIITPCNGCYNPINDRATGRLRVRYLSDVFLEALGEKNYGSPALEQIITA